MSNNPFTPLGATASIAASVTTASVALTGVGAGATGGFAVRIHNSGTTLAFVEFGTSAVAAVAATGVPVPAGGVEIFTVGSGVTHVAAIMASGTATIYATCGQGD